MPATLQSLAHAQHSRDIKAVLSMGYFVVRFPVCDSLPHRVVSALYRAQGADHERSKIGDNEFWERYRLNDAGRALLQKWVG